MKNIIKCPVCRAEGHSPVRKGYYFRGNREEFTVTACNNCGFWFTNPQPEGEALATYYQTDNYVSHTDGGQGLMDWVYKKVRSFAVQSKLSILEKWQPQKGKLLDYGAGTGAFLVEAKKRGWQVSGVEPSAVARENARSKGIILLNPDNRESISDASQQVISLWHVLEHLPDLNECMAYFHRKLSKSGYLVIAVPNHESKDALSYGNDWAALDLPLHLWHFAKSDINNLSKTHNYKLLDVVNMPFDAFYVSLLSEKNRTKKTNLLRALWRGLVSNIQGRGKSKNMSSLIYILQKN